MKEGLYILTHKHLIIFLEAHIVLAELCWQKYYLWFTAGDTTQPTDALRNYKAPGKGNSFLVDCLINSGRNCMLKGLSLCV